jgi:hypothetical protein
MTGPTTAGVASSRTWMPTTGGILCTLTGAANIAVSLFIYAFVGRFMVGSNNIDDTLGITMLFFLLLSGVLAIIGGIAALRRKVWGLALAGTIAGFLSYLWFLGVIALILIVQSRCEFTS